MVENKAVQAPAPSLDRGAASVGAGGAAGSEEAGALWERARANLREQPSLAGLADELRIVGVSAGVVTLAASSQSQANYARSRADLLGEIFSRAGEGPGRLRVDIRLVKEAGSGQTPEQSRAIPGSVAQAEAAKNPLVKRAIELFDARVVEVRDEAD